MKNHLPRKRFGQNFLKNEGVIYRIIQAIAPKSGDNIVEIGPGLGALTKPLLEEMGHLTVIELDRDLIPALEALGNLTIYQADALEFDFSALSGNLRIIGNLPYNISTPLLFHLFSYLPAIKDMLFMLQKEVVVRLAAKPGTKDYGRLSVMAQYYCKVEHLFNVGRAAFRPQPKVESAIVRFIPHRPVALLAIDERQFSVVVRTAFNQRRKTLHNSLKSLINTSQLQQLDIDPQIRPEQVSVTDYVRISNFLSIKE